MWLDLRPNNRCHNAKSCYDKCLDRFHKPTISPEKHHMEINGDVKLIENTCFSYDMMYIGYVTEDKQEFTNMINAGHTHVVYTDRSKINDDCDAIPGTSDIYQIDAHLNQFEGATNYPVTTYNLPCSCISCRSYSVNDCQFRSSYKSKFDFEGY